MDCVKPRGCLPHSFFTGNTIPMRVLKSAAAGPFSIVVGPPADSYSWRPFAVHFEDGTRWAATLIGSGGGPGPWSVGWGSPHGALLPTSSPG